MSQSQPETSSARIHAVPQNGAAHSYAVVDKATREYLMERRRALYLELDHIEKALDLPRKGK